KIANELRNKKREHFVDNILLADIYYSLEHVAHALSTVNGSQAQHPNGGRRSPEQSRRSARRCKCSIRLSNQIEFRTLMRSRKLATARLCRRGPARAYLAIRDGWPTDARKSKAASRCVVCGSQRLPNNRDL